MAKKIKNLMVAGRLAEIQVDYSNGDVYYDFGNGNWYLRGVKFKDGEFKVNGSSIPDGELAYRIKKDLDSR